ncbi:MAG: 1,4-alpha-glucan branching enzyme [Anaerolineaceae bacterium 4572_78]|nr:MAG: 1,4-alpha-glucan branching enzyme [Anaerolineaceae bacterium 4572_78]
MDRYLFAQGTNERAYEKLGAHVIEKDGVKGVHFAVWAPAAHYVAVIGDFNDWDKTVNPMEAIDNGIWICFIPEIDYGATYKYHIDTPTEYSVDKSDPYGFATQFRPETASIVTDIDSYKWQDSNWMENRKDRQGLDKPISIYEVHLGSWKRNEKDEYMTYRELADDLVSYVQEVFWLDKYHIDGLRVDAVASMLYLDYSREAGEWVPNSYGGRENLEAIHVLRKFNEIVHGIYPDIMTFAEESTAWPMVSRPVYVGGLGFDFKWNMGWMHDTISYMKTDSLFRRYHHNSITFSIWYAFNENFILPFSHDEVVHMKGSMIEKMSGVDWWQKFANLRLCYAYMYGHPGKKLLFMGHEFAQWAEWNFDLHLDWNLLAFPTHQGVSDLVRDLNHLYKNEPSLHEDDFSPNGFEWIDCNDSDNSVLAFIRFDKERNSQIVFVCNFTPVISEGYQLGVDEPGFYYELINSDDTKYGGSGINNGDGIETQQVEHHGREHSLYITIPPLATIAFKRQA